MRLYEQLRKLLAHKTRVETIPAEVRSKYKSTYGQICADIDRVFGEIYDHEKITAFHKKHCCPQAEADWLAIQDDMGQFTTDFEREMAVAVINEIERVYKLRRDMPC